MNPHADEELYIFLNVLAEEEKEMLLPHCLLHPHTGYLVKYNKDNQISNTVGG